MPSILDVLPTDDRLIRSWVVPFSALGQRAVWDPFHKHRVFALDETYGNSGRMMLYTTPDRCLFYVEDDGNLVDDLRAPGVQVDPREFWPECRSRWMRAKGADDTIEYFKHPLTNEWYPGSKHTLEHFVNEIEVYETLRRMGTQNICGYLGCEVEEGLVMAIVLQRYPRTLQTAVQAHQSLDAVRILDGLRSAPAHLHSLGLAHNDVNPQNVLIDDEGRAILIDFECCLPYGIPLTWKWGTEGFAPKDGFRHSAKENDDFGFRAVVEFLNAGETD